jgi:hypothetical protein
VTYNVLKRYIVFIDHLRNNASCFSTHMGYIQVVKIFLIESINKNKNYLDNICRALVVFGRLRVRILFQRWISVVSLSPSRHNWTVVASTLHSLQFTIHSHSTIQRDITLRAAKASLNESRLKQKKILHLKSLFFFLLLLLLVTKLGQRMTSFGLGKLSV